MGTTRGEVYNTLVSYDNLKARINLTFRKNTEIDKFLTELLTFEVYDVIVSLVRGLDGTAATDASNRKFSPRLSSLCLKSLCTRT